MEYTEIYTLLGISERLLGHPHLAHLRELSNQLLARANLDAKGKVEGIKNEEANKRSADERSAADKQIHAEAQARTHQDGKPTPVRNTYDGVPGPAELGAPTEALSAPKAFPSGPDLPGDPQLPNIDRRT